MDDLMIDLMAGNDELARRLGAFGRARLSPDLTATSRMRARVLAVAHRQAALARADAALSIVGPVGAAAVDATGVATGSTRRGASRTLRQARRVAGLAVAAMVAVGMIGGTALAAQPGAPLYGQRMWVETILLPTDPSERAVAEVKRLDERLREATRATAAGDGIGAAAALSAYGTILDQASEIDTAGASTVAGAALAAGISHNVDVLRALVTGLPDDAASAITVAIDRAIERSEAAHDKIAKPGGGGGNGDGGNGNGGNGGNGGANGGGGAGAGNGNGGNGSGGNGQPAAGPPGSTTATPTPEPAVEPTPEAKPDPTPRKTPKPPPDQGDPPHGPGKPPKDAKPTSPPDDPGPGATP